MPFDPREFRLQILKDLCQVGGENYKENVRTIGLLEDKAQKTAALAGIFLAATLAFIKPDTFEKWPFNRLRVWIPLSTAVVLLIACIAFSVAVLWIRSIVESVPFPSVEKFKAGLFGVEAKELHKYEEGYWEDTAAIWKQILAQQSPITASKANRLLWAQVTLALAMLSVAALLLLIIQPFISKLFSGS